MTPAFDVLPDELAAPPLLAPPPLPPMEDAKAEEGTAAPVLR
jgi:hypothetical protein